MKHLFLLCLLIFSCINLVNAQTNETPRGAKFNLYVEGSTLVFINSISINLEGKLNSDKSEKIHLYGRAGFGKVDVSTLIFCDGQNASGGLLGLTLLIGKMRHHFEVNGGAFLGSFKSKNNDSGIFGSCNNQGFKSIPIIGVGYRFQNPEGGFIFRANLGSLGLGIGLGHAF